MERRCARRNDRAFAAARCTAMAQRQRAGRSNQIAAESASSRRFANRGSNRISRRPPNRRQPPIRCEHRGSNRARGISHPQHLFRGEQPANILTENIRRASYKSNHHLVRPSRSTRGRVDLPSRDVFGGSSRARPYFGGLFKRLGPAKYPLDRSRKGHYDPVCDLSTEARLR